jgi:hypothetical protein
MPAFGERFNDEQAGALVAYLRGFGPAKVHRPQAGNDFDKQVQKLEQEWEELERQLQLLRDKQKKK